MIIWKGGPLNRHQITRMLKRVAKAAGIGHVHPHQLRHTLATQAINRGMSLEAVAAMLGHKTLRMTLVYARVADQTVADAYDTVTDQVDALYTKPAGLKSNGNGSAGMTRLATEYDQRMLGNGYCNRPTQLDCQYESICETCAYYTTDQTFQPVLDRSTRPRRRPRPTPPSRPLPNAHRPQPTSRTMTVDYPHIPKSFDTITPISADPAHSADCSFVHPI